MANTRGFPANPGSLKEGAERFNVSTWTIRRLIASGELRAYRLGTKLIRIDMDELAELFRPIPAVGDDVA